jgi:predicted nucleic-acid-binding Zn-ribbon protein
MTPSPPKKCPKCGDEMANDRQLGSYTEITLKKGEQFLGDRVQAFYCVKCGYIELYREKEK